MGFFDDRGNGGCRVVNREAPLRVKGDLGAVGSQRPQGIAGELTDNRESTRADAADGPKPTILNETWRADVRARGARSAVVVARVPGHVDTVIGNLDALDV